MANDIDCVILWVDGSDKKWLDEKNKYLPDNEKIEFDDDEERFRDFGILKYLFRGIEINAEWFRKVFFVTCGQIPCWLNIHHPKLVLVDHRDFIPAEYLPTFNSHTIELNLHRINGLSQKFVYFNDDMFILKRMSPKDFFRGDQPCDAAILNAFAIQKNEKDFRFLMPINDIEIINKHFDKRKVLKKYWYKYFNIKYGTNVLRTVCLMPWRHFTGFTINHMPYSIKKEYLEELWNKEAEILHRTCLHKFRNSNDVNIWLVMYWQFAKGDFHPRSPKIGFLTKVSDEKEHNREVYSHIIKQKTKLICINDNVSTGYSSIVKTELNQAFQKIYPDKSSFEI